ncbi:hypothetical protein C455_09017 [Haloferax larsenii JCM 13917]|nr:hypothetical protein C455_09017 [Haloferax larsenii JCM 13917]
MTGERIVKDERRCGNAEGSNSAHTGTRLFCAVIIGAVSDSSDFEAYCRIKNTMRESISTIA